MNAYVESRLHTADEPIWQTSDPFDLCTDSAAIQQPSLLQADAKLGNEERRRKRQETHRARRESRKQQCQGELLSDADHDDIFGKSPR